MHHALRALPALLAACASPPASQAEVLGVDADAPPSARLERCGGQGVVALEPGTAVTLSLGPGMHALEGRFAPCDEADDAVVAMRVELASGGRALLTDRITRRERGLRSSSPFAVTFWTPSADRLHLRVARGRGGFGALALRTVPFAPEPVDLGPPLVPEDGRGAREPTLRGGEVPLGEYGWAASENGYGPVEVDANAGELGAGDGGPLVIGERAYARGVGAHAPSHIWVPLERRCRRFVAEVGVDARVAPRGSVIFEVWVDERRALETPVLRGGQPAVPIDVDLRGASWLLLRADDAGDDREDDYADWADARLECRR